MTEPIYKTSVLIKFGDQKYMEALLQGKIYCNTLHFFAELEDSNGRSDIDETKVEIINHKFLGGNIQLSKSYDPNYACGNLFCLYHEEIIITEPNKQFKTTVNAKIDDYCVVITHPNKFIDRFKKQLIKQKHTPRYGFVKYKDLKQLNGTKDIFDKDVSYNWQKEYRFYFPHKKNKFKIFDIGSISDIAFIKSVAELNTMSAIYFDIEKLVKEKILV